MTAVVSRSNGAIQSQDNGAHNPQLESFGGLESTQAFALGAPEAIAAAEAERKSYSDCFAASQCSYGGSEMDQAFALAAPEAIAAAEADRESYSE